MGTTRRTKYRIIAITNEGRGGFQTLAGVDKIVDLKKWCERLEQSELPGGVNEISSRARGFLLSISTARLIRQSDAKQMREYRAAPFRLM